MESKWMLYTKRAEFEKISARFNISPVLARIIINRDIKEEDFSIFLQNDLNTVLEKIIPNHTSATTYSYPGPEHYKDVESWPNVEEYLPNGDRSALWNGDAHLKATILGNSVTLDVEKNKLAVGKTGYVYFVDFDRTRERTRKFSVIVIG